MPTVASRSNSYQSRPPTSDLTRRSARHVFLAGCGGSPCAVGMVPIEGGEPTEIVKANFAQPEPSMSHRTVAGWRSSRRRPRTSLWSSSAIYLPARTVSVCLCRRTFRSARAWMRWTPDGQSIAYVDTNGSNIWSQPLDGGPPRQITHFSDRQVASFAWSRDGKRLAVARTTTTNDIVLLRGSKK